MNIRRSWLVFLVMLLITACIFALAAEKPILESWNALHDASSGTDWQCVGAGSGKVAAVAGWRNGSLLLRYFSIDGTLMSQQRVTLPAELSGGTVSRLIPARQDLAYLGIYGPNAKKLYLYRVNESGEAECLLSRECAGESFQERSSRTRLSEFLYEDGVTSFAVWTDDTLECFVCREDGGLETVGSGRCDDSRVLSVLSDQSGALLLGGTDVLIFNGQPNETLFAGQSVSHLKMGKGGWYYIDEAQLDLCFVDAAFGATYRMVHLNTVWDGVERCLSSVALDREEDALLLLDGTVLTIADSEGTQELTGILHAKTSGLWLDLLKYAAFAFAAAIVLWLLLCGLRHGYASLVVFRGSLFVAIALLSLVVLRYAVLIPTTQDSAMRVSEAVVTGMLQTAHAERRMDDESVAEEVCLLVENANSERGTNVRALLADHSSGEWRTADGRLAVTQDIFSPAVADAALESGSARATLDESFYYVFTEGDKCLSIRVESPTQPDDGGLYDILLASFVFLSVGALLILLSVGLDLRHISSRMEILSRGKVPERLELHTGDELESMASIVNSLGVSLRDEWRKRKSVEKSYRRFVPEKVLALLGKQTVEEVDKTTFAARRMAVMTVWFTFPDPFYTDMSSSRLMFDSVNEVIERAASIAAKKGGTAFHFSYYGFDIVMEEDGEAVSTAVAIQQEVLSFNEQRELNGLPRVALHIALDRGNVMLGIVGDTSKMEPTMISSCLSTTQELIRLSKQLRAGILCTEAIISEQQGYGNRYMGKCDVGGQSVRVYEVFDGDEFNVRRGKAASLSEFSQGVYDLYGGDAAKAKHAFLQLAHSYPLDGGARYYLYLADRLEHDPSLPCVLNADHSGGEEL